MAQSYLKPKVGDPLFIREKRNGQFINPPVYMQWGGFRSKSGLRRSEDGNANMALERGGPGARQGKPI